MLDTIALGEAIFFQESTFENVVSEMWTILNRSLYDRPCAVVWDSALTDLPLVPHTYVSESSQYWFRWWLIAYSTSNHNVYRYWVLSNGSLGINFLIKIQNFSFTKVHLNLSSTWCNLLYISIKVIINFPLIGVGRVGGVVGLALSVQDNTCTCFTSKVVYINYHRDS